MFSIAMSGGWSDAVLKPSPGKEREREDVDFRASVASLARPPSVLVAKNAGVSRVWGAMGFAGSIGLLASAVVALLPAPDHANVVQWA